MKEWFRPAPKLTGDASGSLRGAASPGIKIESQSFHGSLFQNLRDIIAPPKLPPLELTSTAIDVPEIWSKQKAFSGSKAFSMILHVGITVAAVLVFSIRQATTVERPKLPTYLIAAPAPGAPPPPPPAAAPAAVHSATFTKPRAFLVQEKLTTPIRIPKLISEKTTGDDAGAPDLGGMPGGDSAGVLGGQPGGLPGGIPGGISGAPAPPGGGTSARSGPVHPGGNIKQPRAIYAPDPEFPPMARKAKIDGTVVLDAVIDEHGNVVKLHPIKGNPLLIDAALKAVSQWKYEPTYLNGEPVSVEMEVKVLFNYI